MIERPVARYGSRQMSPRTRRWITFALVGLVVAAGVILAVVAFQRLGTGEVKGELSAYELIDDQTVSVTIGVTRPSPSGSHWIAATSSWICSRPRAQLTASRPSVHW